jgi:hypothetical protein
VARPRAAGVGSSAAVTGLWPCAQAGGACVGSCSSSSAAATSVCSALREMVLSLLCGGVVERCRLGVRPLSLLLLAALRGERYGRMRDEETREVRAAFRLLPRLSTVPHQLLHPASGVPIASRPARTLCWRPGRCVRQRLVRASPVAKQPHAAERLQTPPAATAAPAAHHRRGVHLLADRGLLRASAAEAQRPAGREAEREKGSALKAHFAQERAATAKHSRLDLTCSYHQQDMGAPDQLTWS